MGKLLVVDDDEMQVYQASHNDIALVIMDIMMPRMDGIAALKAIKEADPYAKVILMSGYSEHDPAKAQADAFLPKHLKVEVS